MKARDTILGAVIALAGVAVGLGVRPGLVDQPVKLSQSTAQVEPVTSSTLPNLACVAPAPWHCDPAPTTSTTVAATTTTERPRPKATVPVRVAPKASPAASRPLESAPAVTSTTYPASVPDPWAGRYGPTVCEDGQPWDNGQPHAGGCHREVISEK
jgi:hypothetical protein